MKKYKIEITPLAYQELEDIYNYIANNLQALQTALEQYSRISKAIFDLDTFPERYTLVDFEPEHSMGIHRMSVDNYSVFYIIIKDRVKVINVLYSASNIEERLKQR